MSVFNYNSCSLYLKNHIAESPKRGWGLVSQYAEEIGVSSALMSKVVSGDKQLTSEQACLMAKVLNFSELETDYFVYINELERAGNQELKAFWKKKVSDLKNKSLKVSNRIDVDKSLNDEEKSIFYSSYLYAAISLYCSLSKNGKTLEQICERFFLDRQKALDVLTFLIRSGLCTFENDRYKIGTRQTHLAQGSPYLAKHYINWHLRAINKIENLSQGELMFSSPVSISKKDFDKVREQFVVQIKEFLVTVKDSPEEDLACLNIDWFWIDK
ncbi:MAG: DUF4423 domain-containing protein [Bdellovibrionaceae bacterium]|nr:DUF4423 domain-containing protein [Pseudobdellovibrionaceae bacterium]